MINKAKEIEVNLDSIPKNLSKSEYIKYNSLSTAFFDLYLKRSQFNGGMLVAKKGQIVFEQYAGFHNLNLRDSITQNSPFHLASVSKTFTGMAVCMLWQEGKLKLDDEVSTYLNGFDYPGLTIRNLLSHRSGLPNYVHVIPESYKGRGVPLTNQDVLQFFIENKSKLGIGRPDRNFVYCNTNYALLALIIEKVSGLSYPAYLKQTFFEPLGMKHTFVCTTPEQQEENPSYNWRAQKEIFTFQDLVYGDKNIYSTPRDMLKWDIGLSNGKLFKPETLAAAYSGYSFERKGIRNYGLGWRLYLYPDNRKIIYHNGWWHGNNTVFARLVEDSATVIILGNKFNKRIYESKKLYSALGSYEEGSGEE